MQIPGLSSWSLRAAITGMRQSRVKANSQQKLKREAKHMPSDWSMWPDRSKTLPQHLGQGQDIGLNPREASSDVPVDRRGDDFRVITSVDLSAFSHTSLKRRKVPLGVGPVVTPEAPVTYVTDVTTLVTTVAASPSTSTRTVSNSLTTEYTTVSTVSAKSHTSTESGSSSNRTSSTQSTTSAKTSVSATSKSAPTSTSSSHHQSSNSGTIAGAVIGAIVLLILLAALIVCFARRHRRKFDERRSKTPVAISGPVLAYEVEKPSRTAAAATTTPTLHPALHGFEQHVPPSHVAPGLRAEDRSSPAAPAAASTTVPSAAAATTGNSTPESLATLPALTYKPHTTPTQPGKRQTYEPPRPESLTRDIVQMLDSATASPRTTRSGSIIVRRDVRQSGWSGVMRSPRFQEIFGNGQLEYRSGSEDGRGIVDSPTLGYDVRQQQHRQQRADDARRRDLAMYGYI